MFLFLTDFSFETQIELFLELIVGAHCLNEFERKNATHVVYDVCVLHALCTAGWTRTRLNRHMARAEREQDCALRSKHNIYKCVPAYKMIQLILSGHRTLEMTRLARTHVTKVQYTQLFYYSPMCDGLHHPCVRLRLIVLYIWNSNSLTYNACVFWRLKKVYARFLLFCDIISGLVPIVACVFFKNAEIRT